MHQSIITANYSILGPNYLQSPVWGTLEDARDGIIKYLALTDYPTISLMALIHGHAWHSLLAHRNRMRTVASVAYGMLARRPDLRHSLEVGNFEEAHQFILEDAGFNLVYPDLEARLENNMKLIRAGAFHAGN